MDLVLSKSHHTMSREFVTTWTDNKICEPGSKIFLDGLKNIVKGLIEVTLVKTSDKKVFILC